MRSSAAWVMLLLSSACFGQTSKSAAPATGSAGLEANPAAPATNSAATSAAEKARIEQLISQLGAPKWNQRQAAQAELERMLEQAEPILEQHRNDPDPEVASRILKLLGEDGLAQSGAMVFWVEPNSQAQRLGIKSGDVILQIGETVIAGQTDLNNASRDARTYELWRGGKRLKLQLQPGRAGVQCIDWSLAKGGRYHSLGMSAANAGDYAAAYDNLRKAFDRGTDDNLTLLFFAALAEYNADHQRALKAYDLCLKQRQDGDVSYLADWPLWRGGVPDGLLAAFRNLPARSLLRKLDDNPQDFQLRAIAETWCIKAGQTTLLNELLARKWDDTADATSSARHYSALAAVAFQNRDWARVLECYDKAPNYRTADWAMQAALFQGDLDKACRLALTLLKGDDFGYKQRSDVLYVLTAARAGGRVDLAKELWDAIVPLGADTIDAMFAQTNAGRMLRLQDIDERLLASPHAPQDMTGNWWVLGLYCNDPSLTREKWQQALSKFPLHSSWRSNQGYAGAIAALHMGDYQAFIDDWKQRYPATTPALDQKLQAAFVLKQYGDRLQTDMKVLNGMYSACCGAEKGSYWCLKVDGDILYIDPAGKVTQYPVAFPYDATSVGSLGLMFLYQDGVMCWRQNQIYLLDRDKQRFVPTYASNGEELPVWVHSAPAVPAVQYLVKEYPTDGPGREVLRSDNGPKGWRWFTVNGDRAIAVKGTAVVNIGREIQALAGRQLSVYTPISAGDIILIPTNGGLWRMDPAGKVTRADMEPDMQNLTLVAMRWPVREGKKYIGVVPQQGGKVYDYDIASGKFSLTDGYCGLGPEDAFSLFNSSDKIMRCQYAIEAIWRKAHEPATQPSK